MWPNRSLRERETSPCLAVLRNRCRTPRHFPSVSYCKNRIAVVPRCLTCWTFKTASRLHANVSSFCHLFSSTWYSCLLSLWISQSQSAGLAWPQPNSTWLELWGNSGLYLTRISFQCATDNWAKTWCSPVPCLYLAAVDGLPHTKIIISPCPPPPLSSLFYLTSQQPVQREQIVCHSHRNNTCVSQFIIQIFGGKILQPIHIMESPLFSKWGSMICWCRSL